MCRITETITDQPVVKIERTKEGFTNHTYLVHLKNDEKVIIRVAGEGTEEYIDRKAENYNCCQMGFLGISPKVIYCNEETGIKLSEYIDNAETFTPRTAKLEENIALTAAILHDLHTSDIVWENRFDGFDESTRYEELLGDASRMYDGFTSLKRKVYALLRPRLYELGYEQKPCHNDLVAANLVKNSLTGRLYLIDWEYAGTNDPMFDVAALFLENEFSPEDEELFFRYYFGEQPTDAVREKILIFKILQDYLWSIWTVLKESRGDDFGSYGIDRFTRAQRNAALWESRF